MIWGIFRSLDNVHFKIKDTSFPYQDDSKEFAAESGTEILRILLDIIHPEDRIHLAREESIDFVMFMSMYHVGLVTADQDTITVGENSLNRLNWTLSNTSGTRASRVKRP